ncbi:hypothetical protein HG531_007769 [Fusarium graminearum]|nr:hypothetical protein HG531_007769 [Fusarium graminearum]
MASSPTFTILVMRLITNHLLLLHFGLGGIGGFRVGGSVLGRTGGGYRSGVLLGGRRVLGDLAGENLSAIAEENDPASVPTNSKTSSLVFRIHLITTVAILEIVVDTRSSEFGCRGIMGSTWAIAVSDSAGDLLVPLILGLSVEEANDAHGHVVAADTAGLRVGGQAVVHHVLANLFEFLLGSDASSNELNHGLGGLAIPDTYASSDNLVLRR